jgi:hypothetical protein
VSSLFPVITKARAHRLTVTGNLVSGTFLILGILGMLRTQFDETLDLTIFRVHPLTAVIWFVLGVVGVAMCVDARRAQVFLAGAGALLVLWGLLCLALDGTPSDLFARDRALIVLLLVSGAASLTVALAPPVTRIGRALG